MSGGASLPPSPAPAFQYPNQPQAAQGAFGGAQGIQTNANNVNSAYNAPGATSIGSNLTTTAQAPLGYVGQALNTAFDPQYALRQQEFNNQQQQNLATQAQQGVSNTPYGAGLTQQGNQNFDIAWQQAQLANQGQGANTAATLLGGAGGAGQTGTAIGQSVPGFQTAQEQQAIADFLAYLSGGTAATNAATSQYGAESSAAIQNQQVSNQALGGLGQLGGNLLGGISFFPGGGLATL